MSFAESIRRFAKDNPGLDKSARKVKMEIFKNVINRTHAVNPTMIQVLVENIRRCCQFISTGKLPPNRFKCRSSVNWKISNK